MIILRYADDIVVGFEREADALAAGMLAVDLAWDARRKHIELLPPA